MVLLGDYIHLIEGSRYILDEGVNSPNSDAVQGRTRLTRRVEFPELSLMASVSADR